MNEIPGGRENSTPIRNYATQLGKAEVKIYEKHLSMKEMKAKCKPHGMTLNDYFVMCLGKATKNYIHKREPENKVEMMAKFIGQSYRSSFTLSNKIYLAFVRLPIPKDPSAPLLGLLPRVKEEMNLVMHTPYKFVFHWNTLFDYWN